MHEEMKKEMHFGFLLTTIYFVSISMILTAASFLNAFAQNNAATAETMFQTKSLTLPPKIKHLVILVPNEAHESQYPGHPSYDQRLINQIYIA